MTACYNGHEEVVEYLISQGAEIGFENGLGETAIDCAETEQIKKILQNPGIFVKSKFLDFIEKLFSI